MLIVLEGLDGAGKSTQMKMLKSYILSKNMKLKYLHFPRYDAPVWGELIAKFLRGDFGTIDWDGTDPRRLTLRGIPKSIEIKTGDTVLTSTYSYNFPPGYMVGTIAEVVTEKSTNFYILKIKPGANFYNIKQVFVVENLQYSEQITLNQETRKKIEDPKNIKK